MFKGFNVNEASESDEIRTSVNQGKFMLKIAEKIKNNEQLNDREKAWAIGIIEARGKDQINNAKKYISKNENGSPAHPNRYEAVSLYYGYLKVLKIKNRAMELVCYDYGDISMDNLKSWVKQEVAAGSPIKKTVEHHIIHNPESIDLLRKSLLQVHPVYQCGN